MAVVNNGGTEFDIKVILDSKKFIPVWLARREAAEKNAELPPYSVECHFTSACNYSCYHCSYAGRRKAAVSLKKTRIESLLDDLTGALKPQGVYFSGGGEPTAQKEWDSHLARILDAGAEAALITNGSLIKPRHLELIARLNYIAVSIYSTDPKTAEKITGSDKIGHSFSLPAGIKKHGNKTLVGARCVINKFNFREIPAIYQKAIDSGYDYIIFIPEIDYESRGICLTAEQVHVLVESAGTTQIDSKRTNFNTLVENRFNYYPRELKDECFRHTGCHAVKLRTNAFINFDGGVYLCQPHIGNPVYCVGNVNEDKFRDIWNSKRHVEVIGLLSAEWASGKCANCRSIAFNRAVYEHIQAGGKEKFDAPIDVFI